MVQPLQGSGRAGSEAWFMALSLVSIKNRIQPNSAKKHWLPRRQELDGHVISQVFPWM